MLFIILLIIYVLGVWTLIAFASDIEDSAIVILLWPLILLVMGVLYLVLWPHYLVKWIKEDT